MTIFKNYVKIYKELEEEVKFYSRENFMKQREIERLRKEIKELKKQIGGNKNETKIQSRGRARKQANRV